MYTIRTSWLSLPLSVLLIARSLERKDPKDPDVEPPALEDSAASTTDLVLPEPLPFEECPPTDQLKDLRIRDFEVDGLSVSYSGTLLTCGTWGLEEDLKACYTKSVDVIAAVEEDLLELGAEALGGLGVACDASVDVICGPIPPEAQEELFDDGRFRCCFNVEVSLECGL